MSKSFKEDLTGKRFGRWTVLEFVPKYKRGSYWKCKCDCGTIKTISGDHLKGGKSKSCGCLRAERAKETKSTHGLSSARLYNIWRSMKTRCYNRNHDKYESYGGRGIVICDAWRNDFKTFYDWAMSHGYADNLSIDRIDANGNYCPENCRWEDKKTQQRNKRNNIIIEHEGKKRTLPEIAEQHCISYDVVYHRYRSGDRGEKLFRPVICSKK